MAKVLRNNHKMPKGEIGPMTLLIGSSLVAQLMGVWLAGIFLGIGHIAGGSFAGLLISSLMILIFGFPFIMLVWLLVTLPVSAICMHFGINQNILKTASIGIIFGILAAHLLGFAGFGKPGLSFDTAIWGSLNGGLVAGLFSLFSKSWGDQTIED